MDAGALDETNREPEHQQFWFPDGENRGFFNDSQVREERVYERDDYACEGRIYDDKTLWEAIENVGNPGPYSLLGDGPVGWLFGVGQNNCQDWADQVTAEYERLRSEFARRTGVDPEVEYVWNSLMND